MRAQESTTGQANRKLKNDGEKDGMYKMWNNNKGGFFMCEEGTAHNDAQTKNSPLSRCLSFIQSQPQTCLCAHSIM